MKVQNEEITWWNQCYGERNQRKIWNKGEHAHEKFVNYRILGLQLGIKDIKIADTQKIGVFKGKRKQKGNRPIKERLENEEDKNKFLRPIATYNNNNYWPLIHVLLRLKTSFL